MQKNNFMSCISDDRCMTDLFNAFCLSKPGFSQTKVCSTCASDTVIYLSIIVLEIAMYFWHAVY